MGTLREEREARNMTREELAAAAEVSLSTVNRAEDGVGSINRLNARRIARALNMAVKDLQGLNVRTVGKRRAAATDGNTK